LIVSRIFLDNFDHIQASWFSEGKRPTDCTAFRADDFGGTLLEENVHAAANFVNKTNTEECIALIMAPGLQLNGPRHIRCRDTSPWRRGSHLQSFNSLYQRSRLRGLPEGLFLQ
jgi:hypothetical protein